MSDNNKPPQDDKKASLDKQNNIEEQPVSGNPEPNNKKKSQPSQLKDSSKPSDGEELFNAKALPKMQPPKKSTTQAQYKIFGFGFLALLLIVSVAVSAYTFYQNMQVQQAWQKAKAETTEQLKQFQNQVVQSQNQVTSQQQENQVKQRQINQQQQKLNQLTQALTATQQKVRTLSGRQKQDWHLAEAEYLIGLAGFKINLESDIKSAIVLLKTADQRIVKIADNDLLELRQALANDITQLEAITVPDVNGIASQLMAVSQQIPHLQLVALELDVAAKNAAESKASDTPKGSNQNTTLDQENKVPVDNEEQGLSFKNIYQNFLSDFVVIKDHSTPLKPLMTINQRTNLNANIQLALQQAQLALFRNDKALYQHHLSQAKAWVNLYFVLNVKGENVVKQLQELMAKNIVLDAKTDLESSVTVKAINQQRLYQWLDNKDESKLSTEPVESTAAEPTAAESAAKPKSIEPKSTEPKSTEPKSTESSEGETL